ncbi:MAG TPA: hypothetical protein VJ719_03425, partial [Chthoniobacterales bacterium]|nr:hypothetical protein [Chthoniobacterales bacterium]
MQPVDGARGEEEPAASSFARYISYFGDTFTLAPRHRALCLYARAAPGFQQPASAGGHRYR